jgi:hypothetical protein
MRHLIRIQRRYTPDAPDGRDRAAFAAAVVTIAARQIDESAPES